MGWPSRFCPTCGRDFLQAQTPGPGPLCSRPPAPPQPCTTRLLAGWTHRAVPFGEADRAEKALAVLAESQRFDELAAEPLLRREDGPDAFAGVSVRARRGRRVRAVVFTDLGRVLALRRPDGEPLLKSYAGALAGALEAGRWEAFCLLDPLPTVCPFQMGPPGAQLARLARATAARERLLEEGAAPDLLVALGVSEDEARAALEVDLTPT